MLSWERVLPGLLGEIEAAENVAYSEDFLQVCPPRSLVVRTLELVPPESVRIVVIGQDPYHTPGKASGLAFGYHPQYTGPVDSSLANIQRELGSDIRPDLIGWADQGVLLLNTALTVLAGKPLSHAGIRSGIWSQVVGRILGYLAGREDVVWLLWGSHAIRAAEHAGVDTLSSRVIMTSHPCQFSASRGSHPFLGSKCFVRANEQLINLGIQPINWIGR